MTPTSVAIVTRASQGIGGATALRLAHDFDVVVLVALASPAVGFALVCGALFTYFRPDPFGTPPPSEV
jgi:NAD(P)-dependent dehydrogenase (short-subunit alcohol dehydrogenase family)